MYSAQLMELFHHGTHPGPLPEATHRGEGGTAGGGPYIQFWLRVEDGVVQAARFKSYGCPAAIACAEAACNWAEGKTLKRIQAVTPAAVAEWVGGVPDGKEHCPELAAAALQVG